MKRKLCWYWKLISVLTCMLPCVCSAKCNRLMLSAFIFFLSSKAAMASWEESKYCTPVEEPRVPPLSPLHKDLHVDVLKRNGKVSELQMKSAVFRHNLHQLWKLLIKVCTHTSNSFSNLYLCAFPNVLVSCRDYISPLDGGRGMKTFSFQLHGDCLQM